MAETGNAVTIQPYKTELTMVMMAMMMREEIEEEEEEEEENKEGEGEDETKGNTLYITINFSHCLIIQLFQNSENHTHP
jgi:hypothetical protein